MKRYILLALLAFAMIAQAQDTYMNERLINNSSDVIGTSRYVGMGGALGALGADMSVISWNPAGIGLYRKNDIALTFGGTWGQSSIEEENRGKGTFDQIGFVYNMTTGSESCPYVNFAFNYQKKINFNHNFYADNNNLGGLSQMDEVAELTDYVTRDNTSLAGLAQDNNFFKKGDEGFFYNEIRSSSNEFTHHSEGALHSFDFNISTNINNRAFLGLTVGVDAMRYRGWNSYWEYLNNEKNHDVYNDCILNGTGINVKLGTIVRPFENSPFRFGIAIETPTWYRLRNSTVMNLNNLYPDGGVESYLKFNLRSPWKVRASIGSTVGSTFAWDIDYEYAAYAGTSMGYPETEYADGSTSGNIKDVAMNQNTRDNLRGTHTLRVGLEANATKNLAFRIGYNLSTSAYNKDIYFNQFTLADNGSTAMRDYATNTNYMRMGAANILTLGIGYHAKKFYVDLAYKIRNQKADFYAFDTNFTYDDYVFKNNVANKYDDLNQTIDPVDVNLTRQAITCTLGFKF